MRVHRFMSRGEYNKLISGQILENHSEHKGRKTTSVGFCFFVEDPREAVHWLNGCANIELCVTFDIPDDLLTESEGTYRDPEKDVPEKDLFTYFMEYLNGKLPVKTVKEYCLTKYSLRDVKIVNVVEGLSFYI